MALSEAPLTFSQFFAPDTSKPGRWLYAIKKLFPYRSKYDLDRIGEIEKRRRVTPRAMDFWSHVVETSLNALHRVASDTFKDNVQVTGIILTGSTVFGLSIPYTSDLDLRIITTDEQNLYPTVQTFFESFRKDMPGMSMPDWSGRLRVEADLDQVTESMLVLPYESYDFGLPDFQYPEEGYGTRAPIDFPDGHLFNQEYLTQLADGDITLWQKQLRSKAGLNGICAAIRLGALHKLAFSSLVWAKNEEATETIAALQGKALQNIESSI